MLNLFFGRGGFAPLDPLPGLCPGSAGGLKRPSDPSPIYFFPPICQLFPPIEIISENTGNIPYKNVNSILHVLSSYSLLLDVKIEGKFSKLLIMTDFIQYI